MAGLLNYCNVTGLVTFSPPFTMPNFSNYQSIVFDETCHWKVPRLELLHKVCGHIMVCGSLPM